jgi:molybdopterin-guanine dinucleotide biosynthesis protein A
MTLVIKPTSIILCGGKALRFGHNKAIDSVGGCTVIERIMRVLEPLSSQIIAVTSADKTDIPLAGKAKVVTDVYPERGPLGGIYTGLLHAQSDLALVFGCDMPFLNAKLISLMLDLADGFDVVVPRLGGRYFEPLHAIYAKTCLVKMKGQLESGQLSIWPVLRELHTRYIEKEEYLPLDPRMLSFFNINTPEDFERANRIAAQMDAVHTSIEENSGVNP